MILGNAADFTYWILLRPFGLEREGLAGFGRGERLREGELLEDAVHGGAGANALDDLLAEIAALVEVQGAGLAGLLGEMTVANVEPIERDPFEDAEGFEGGR